MKLENKKALAARTFDVGKGRIIFNTERLREIKEAITKQDMKDLRQSGAILIKEKKGKRKIVKRKSRRRAGSVKIKVKGGKREYMAITRKLRAYLAYRKSQGTVSKELVVVLRKEIRARFFRSLAHLKERIKEAQKE